VAAAACDAKQRCLKTQNCNFLSEEEAAACDAKQRLAVIGDEADA
jgi:hypothetical protein